MFYNNDLNNNNDNIFNLYNNNSMISPENSFNLDRDSLLSSFNYEKSDNLFDNNNKNNKDESSFGLFKEIEFEKDFKEDIFVNEEYILRDWVKECTTFENTNRRLGDIHIKDNSYKVELTNILHIQNNNLVQGYNIYNNLNMEKIRKYISFSRTNIMEPYTINNYFIDHINSLFIKKNKQSNNICTPNEQLLIKTKRKIKNTKNMGRKTKRASNNNKIINNGKIHDKNDPDNIRFRYKRGFFDSLIKTINNRITKCPKLLKKGKIKKLSGDIMKINKKSEILSMLSKTAKEYLSLNISSKYKNFSKDNNKKLIEYIYKINEKSIIEILDKTIRELMLIYCSDSDKFVEFKDFKRLKYHIENELRAKNHENDSYILLFEDQAINYEKKYKQLDGRYEA